MSRCSFEAGCRGYWPKRNELGDDKRRRRQQAGRIAGVGSFILRTGDSNPRTPSKVLAESELRACALRLKLSAGPAGKAQQQAEQKGKHRNRRLPSYRLDLLRHSLAPGSSQTT
jgi:hypothetical protein